MSDRNVVLTSKRETLPTEEKPQTDETPRELRVSQQSHPKNLSKSQQLKSPRELNGIVQQFIRNPDIIFKYHKHQVRHLDAFFQQYLKERRKLETMNSELKKQMYQLDHIDGKELNLDFDLKELAISYKSIANMDAKG